MSVAYAMVVDPPCARSRWRPHLRPERSRLRLQDAEIFAILARELPRDAVWVTSNLARTRQTAAAILAAAVGPARRRRAARHPGPRRAAPGRVAGAWSASPSMPSARSARTRSGSGRPTSARRVGRASSTSSDRVRPAIERLTVEHRGRDIVAVTHGGTIKVALAVALGLDPQAALSFLVENCSITSSTICTPTAPRASGASPPSTTGPGRGRLPRRISATTLSPSTRREL